MWLQVGTQTFSISILATFSLLQFTKWCLFLFMAQLQTLFLESMGEEQVKQNWSDMH